MCLYNQTLNNGDTSAFPAVGATNRSGLLKYLN